MSQYNLSSELVRQKVQAYLEGEHALTLAILSPDLIVLDASEGFREFQWDSSLEPVGRHVSESILELVGLESGFDAILSGNDKLFSLKNINRENKNGSTTYLSIKAIPLIEEKPESGLVLIIEDTTGTSTLEQQLVQDRNELRLVQGRLSQANEELLKLDRLKSLFLSIAAHDMRSPLTAMRGYTDLAIKTLPQDGKPETQEYLSIVISLVETLNRLISDFLDVDVIEKGNLRIDPVSCNLNRIVLEVAGIMRAVGRRNNILIETNLDDHLPSISADPDRIQQILFNLVGNAIKYTQQGDRVLIETRSEGDHVLLMVTDHGPGIPEAEIPRLFDLFHRTQEARQSEIKGLGLGLFIVKSLVDLHHGQISTTSKLGEGTRFTISLPVRQDAPGGNE